MPIITKSKEMYLDPETDFFCTLLELQYGFPVHVKLKVLSERISWAKGWPDETAAFWNAEAFMWRYKIDKDKKELIARELAFLEGGRNLDVGCGAYSYIPSVGFDISEKMLQCNELCLEKIQGSLEERLPFTDGLFESVTAVFVLNYIFHYDNLFREIHRILADRGYFVMVLSARCVAEWQRQKEVTQKSCAGWKAVLENIGLMVEAYEKENLWFFRCCKTFSNEKVIKD